MSGKPNISSCVAEVRVGSASTLSPPAVTYLSTNLPPSLTSAAEEVGEKTHLFVHPLLAVLLRTETKESSAIGAEMSFGSGSSNKVQILEGSLRY